MALNLQSQQTKILYLPLKDEKLPNLQPYTTLTQSEHSKLNDIKSEVYDVCTGIAKERYSKSFLSEIYRTLKPGGIFMFQIGSEMEMEQDLTLCGFTDIESKTKDQINHVECGENVSVKVQGFCSHSQCLSHRDDCCVSGQLGDRDRRNKRNVLSLNHPDQHHSDQKRKKQRNLFPKWKR